MTPIRGYYRLPEKVESCNVNIPSNRVFLIMTGYNILVEGALHNMILTLPVVKYATVLSDAARCPCRPIFERFAHRTISTTTAHCSIVPGETVVMLCIQHIYVYCLMAPW